MRRTQSIAKGQISLTGPHVHLLRWSHGKQQQQQHVSLFSLSLRLISERILLRGWA